MPQSRREFLQHTGLVTAGILSHQHLRVDGTLNRWNDSVITIVRNGISSYAITTAANSAPAAAFGAKELQAHILAMSGATLPIVPYTDIAASRLPAGVSPRHLIIIGAPAPTTLQDEEFLIEAVGPTLNIFGGGTRGALYGCYALLEDVFGVRWFTNTIARVPHQPTLTIATLPLRDRPAYEYRDPYWAEAFQPDWAVRNRVNGSRVKLGPERGGHVTYGLFVHTVFTLVPPDKYFASHPEYFSVFNGQRVPNKQLCFTNPDIPQIAANTLRELIRAQPDAKIWSVSQMDSATYCQCGPCAAAIQEDGAPSGPLLRFVNAVADIIGGDYPDILIDTLAYYWSEQAPRTRKPRPNVRIRFAAGEACTAHGWDECTKNADVLKRFEGWTKLTTNIYLWMYGTNFQRYLQPIPNIEETAHDATLLSRLGAVGFMQEGAYNSLGGAFAELKSYLLAKLLWNPRRDPQAIISEYLSGVYGAAAPYIQQWIDAQQAEVRAPNGTPTNHAGHFDPPTAPYLPDHLMTNGVTLFDAAERMTTNQASALNEVQKARLSLEFLQWSRSQPNSEDYNRLSRTLATKIARFGMIAIGDRRPSTEFIKALSVHNDT